MLEIRTYITGLLTVIVLPWLATGSVLAAEQDNGYLPQLRLQMDQNTRGSLLSGNDPEQLPILLPRLNSFEPATDAVRPAQSVQQYDARLFYPVSGIHGMSLDLGVNIKYLSAVDRYAQDEGAGRVHNFNQAIPMFHATALFDLPFDGLSASLEGSHRDTEQTRAFDYKAKLQYKWHQGLGLEGGWQHQQYSLEADQAATSLDYESRGLFLDLFMDF